MSKQLPKDLESLSRRGPHTDRSVVIADAITQATSDTGRSTRRGGAVAAALILVTGLAALAYVRADSPDTEDGLPALDVDVGPTATEDTPVSTVRIVPTTCPEVVFEFDEAASAIGLTTASGRSDRNNAGFQLSSDLFLFRQGAGTSDQDPVENPEVEGSLSVTTQDGYATTVYPAASGSPGPRVAFVFPATASPDDACSSWSIGSQDPDRPPADLVALVSGMTMTVAETPASDPDVESINARIPNVQFDGVASDNPGPYFGSQPPLKALPGFEAEVADQEFCGAVAVINSRPVPVDPFDRVVVGVEYFEAIQTYVPTVLAEPFEVVRAWSEAVAKAGSFESPDAPSNGQEFSGAMATITEYYDARCLGLS